MSKKETKVREPLLHMVKRSSLPWWKSWGIRVISVAVALLVCALITVCLTGEDPLGVYAAMIKGAFGTKRRIWGLAQNVAMLLCVSLAVTPAFKMHFWNIGAEGQVLIGGLATASCMILFGHKVSTPMLFLMMVISSMVCAAVWAAIPGYFRAKWNTNETLFTLMMNYIAIQLVSYFTYIWSVPKGSGQIGIINGTDQAGWMPAIAGKPYLLNIIIVAAITVFMYIYLNCSKHGYEIQVVGESENTARYIGVNIKKVIVRTMLLSGALCGVAGFLLVSGTDHTLTRNLAGGRGFTAIMVSWLAKFNPLYMVITSLLLVFLQKGAIEISTVYGLNDSFSEILTGVIIFFIIGSEFFVNYSVKFRHSEKEGA